MQKTFSALAFLGQLMLVIACLFVCPVLVIACLPLADQNNEINILPGWLQWLNTWDDPGCNQGEYEPQVVAAYCWGGWGFKTWYWLGIRNQAYGLFHALAPKVDFYGGSATLSGPGLSSPGGSLFLVQNGRFYFDLAWSFAIGAKLAKVRIGWKLFAIQRFFQGDKTVRPDYDRPTFECSLRVSAK